MRTEQLKKAQEIQEQLKKLASYKINLTGEHKRAVLVFRSYPVPNYENEKSYSTSKNPENPFENIVNEELEMCSDRILLRIEKLIKELEKEFESL